MGRLPRIALTWLLLPIVPVGGEEVLKNALARLGEEAEVFSREATKMLARERLEQRAFEGKWRFPIRLGPPRPGPPEGRYVQRTIVSEYTFTRFADAPGVLYELRQAMEVDGRRLRLAGDARTVLMAGANADDRRKRRMLEQFRRLGLAEAATDFGQLILLFLKQRQHEYHFAPAGSLTREGQPLLVVTYRQIAGSSALTVFEDRHTTRLAVEGEIWFRRPDLLPVRISLTAATREQQRATRHEAVVDYQLSRHGLLVPASVLHRHYENALLVVENRFTYEDFQRFGAESEIRFTPEEPPQ